jgi:hypothetical protein
MLRSPDALKGLDSMGYGKEEVARALGGLVASFFEGYARARNKPRWADKTPNYVDCLSELWELFGPEARFVLVRRHGLDVAYSLADPSRRYPAIAEFVEGEGGNVPVAAGRFWAAQNQKIERFRVAHPQACFVLRYEDLTTAPLPVLKSLFDFLDAPWEPGVVVYNRATHHTGFEDPDVWRRSRIEPNSGRYRGWPPDVIEQVTSACQPMLGVLGYA